MKLAIIGGGPKAVAIAAKSSILKSVLGVDLQLTVFEPEEIGATFSREGGYSDGRTLLCTPVDRDLGFPYQDPFGSLVDEPMLSKFSWRSFLVSGAAEFRLNDWVSRGCPEPSHQHFSRYLKWGFDQARATDSEIQLVQHSVSSVRRTGDSWSVVVTMPDGSETFFDGFSGVVVTGSGEPRESLITDANALHFNAMDFWTPANRDRVLSGLADRIAEDEMASVAIIGDGGAGAAISAFLAENVVEGTTIFIVGPNPFIDSRPPNFYADRLYGSQDAWSQLSEEAKHHFVQRTTRGRVWGRLVEQIQRYPFIQHLQGRVNSAEVYGVGVPRIRAFWSVEGRDDQPFSCDALVDARGFDRLWFCDLFPDCSVHLRPDGVSERDGLTRLEASVNDAFCIEVGGVPCGLHVPDLGSIVNPSGNNLMALGALADAVLSRYR